VTVTQVVSAQRSEDGENNQPKTTEEEQQQAQRTNDSGHDDIHTDGNVVGVVRSSDGASMLVTIALGPGGGERLIVLVPCSSGKCPDIRVGDYLEEDGYQNGVGDPNSYFVAADGLTVWRNGHAVK
jgi:hypothetical protein